MKTPQNDLVHSRTLLYCPQRKSLKQLTVLTPPLNLRSSRLAASQPNPYSSSWMDVGTTAACLSKEDGDRLEKKSKARYAGKKDREAFLEELQRITESASAQRNKPKEVDDDS